MTSDNVGRLVRAYTLAIRVLGILLFAVTPLFDRAWITQIEFVAVVVVAALLARPAQLALGKYAYVTLTPVVALAGVLLLGPGTTVIGLASGTFVADLSILRKPSFAAWVNASRELVGLMAAYGVFALVFAISGATSTVSIEASPALMAFILTYHAISRTLYYFTLALRRKLTAAEGQFILRYETPDLRHHVFRGRVDCCFCRFLTADNVAVHSRAVCVCVIRDETDH